MVKNYESVIIINAALEDEQVETVITKIVDNLKLNSGEVIDVDKWGRKRLAYPIQKSKSGYYLLLRYDAPTDLIKKFERMLRFDENVIRYITILLDKEALQNYENLKKQKAETLAENSENETNETVVEKSDNAE
ncbi:MAG: 30S ribosomal protein S6 [Ignavibacteriae bacterium]|nr:30S ribosomal protein S6 [Ignavibacteriota bacterium]NOG96993.1 30S ribosomal protein S6 [Ignavibacteriota bacterium]